MALDPRNHYPKRHRAAPPRRNHGSADEFRAHLEWERERKRAHTQWRQDHLKQEGWADDDATGANDNDLSGNGSSGGWFPLTLDGLMGK